MMKEDMDWEEKEFWEENIKIKKGEEDGFEKYKS